MTDHQWGHGEEAAGVTRTLNNGLECVRVVTPHVSGLVYAQGAHVAEWQPSGHTPVLWMSQHAVYRAGKALRGGVPVCFPWFGAHASRADLPAHGFARTCQWEYQGSIVEGTSVRMGFTLRDDEQTRAMYPHAFGAELALSFGAELAMELRVHNPAAEPMPFEEALHTYFAVSDVRQVTITGLNAQEYEDKVLNFARQTQAGELRFQGETDRVYLSDTTCVLADPGSNRKIVVQKQSSSTTVIWNPGAEKAKSMSDFGDDEWPQMACIETANARNGAVTLAPRQTHRMLARISVDHAAQ